MGGGESTCRIVAGRVGVCGVEIQGRGVVCRRGVEDLGGDNTTLVLYLDGELTVVTGPGGGSSTGVRTGGGNHCCEGLCTPGMRALPAGVGARLPCAGYCTVVGGTTMGALIVGDVTLTLCTGTGTDVGEVA